MNNSPISFEHFEWLEADDTELSQIAEYLRAEGMPEVAQALLVMPTGRPFFDAIDAVIVAAFQFPAIASKSEKNHLVPATLLIILTGDRVITLHPVEFPSADHVRMALQEGRIERSISSSEFVGKFLKRVVKTRFQFVDELSVIADKLESRVFDSDDKRDLIEELMSLKMTISKARQIAPPQREVVAGIAREIIRMKWEDDGTLDDVVHQINHVIILLDGLKERAEIVTEANEAFLNHSLNTTLKLLTIFSVAMITPTLIAGLFGMNVSVPWQDNNLGFLFVCSLIGAITIGGICFLKFRRLF
jgi:magnesium transporter